MGNMMKPEGKKRLLDSVRRGCPHVSIVESKGYDEFQVTYKGLWPERSAAMCYYTNDLEDAIATARIMEATRESQVFNQDIKNKSMWMERFTPVGLGG